VLSERGGLPLAVALSAANTNDAFALPPLVQAIPAIRSRRGPRRHFLGFLILAATITCYKKLTKLTT
jgi:hypothetical protein